MKKIRYTLEPYKGPGSRYNCPQCGTPKKFARYIDVESNQQLSDHVGRCDRADRCGYHYTPKQYLNDGGIAPKNNFVMSYSEIKSDKPATLIDHQILTKSLTGYDSNNFIKYLRARFSEEQVKSAIEKYKIGTSKFFPGATVFWQLDINGNVRAGKIMGYDKITGKRIKSPKEQINWVHIALKMKSLPDFNLKLCFFGEHLLKDSQLPVAIVESEKTAIIASIYLPQFTWLACGNKGGLNFEKCNLLKGRKVILYPDLGAFDEWNEKAKLYSFRISDLLERKANDDERANGLDLADYLIRFDTSEFAQPATKPLLNILDINKRYLDAQAAGLLDNRPDAETISQLWRNVLASADNQQKQQRYLKQLNEIHLT